MKNGIVLLAKTPTVQAEYIGMQAEWNGSLLDQVIGSEAQDSTETKLAEEVLDWPILTAGWRGNDFLVTPKDDSLSKSYRLILRSLLNLEGFISIISLFIDHDQKRLLTLHGNDCGAIFYEDRIVANFSSRREGDNALKTILDWPQAFDHGVVTEWGITEWEKFFQNSIKKAAEDGIKKAHDDLDFFQNVRFKIKHHKKDVPQ